MKPLFKNDMNWIVAGIAAAIVLPLLSILFAMPFIVAIGISALTFAALVLLLAPKKLFEGIDVKSIGSGKVAFARDLLTEAQPFGQRLLEAASVIRDKEVSLRVGHLATIATDVFSRVEASPESAATVKRFLSYYVPRAAEFAEGFAVLEAKRAPDPGKLEELRDVLGKLDDAFVHYSDSLVDDKLGELDTDLRLLQASLKEDIRTQ
jgi:5-bromo-4-chloroindolyl phosphate hydrolysis protein